MTLQDMQAPHDPDRAAGAMHARLEQALRALPLSEAAIAQVTPRLRDLTQRLYHQRPLPADSSFFRFREKVTAVVNHFLPQGLTLSAYLKAAVKQPPLFSQRPATVQANIERAAQHFAAQGLTVKTYLRAA